MNDFDFCEIESKLIDFFSDAATSLQESILGNKDVTLTVDSSKDERVLRGESLSLWVAMEFYIEKIACLQKEAEGILAKKASIGAMELSENRKKDLEYAFLFVEVVLRTLERERVYAEEYLVSLRSLIV